MPLPAANDSYGSPYARDWSFGAFAPPGLIWVGDIPLPEARDLVAAGWTVVGEALPAPAPEPTPQLEPPPGPPPPGQPEPINDPVIEPRTPVTPPPLEPLPPLERPPIWEPPSEFDIPTPGNLPPWLPPVLPRIILRRLFPIGAILLPDQLGSGELPFPPVPPIEIPPPQVSFPEPRLPPVPDTTPDFPAPAEPDVVVVTAPAPTPISVPKPSPWLSPGSIPSWIPKLFPITRPSPPQPSPTPRVITQPLPTTLPTVPSFSPPPTPVAPVEPPAMPPASLTSLESPPVESYCETPQQTKDRREKRRDDCKKLVTIKIRAHTKRVCMSEAARHEYNKARRNLINKAKREIVGGAEKQLGLKRGTIIVTPGQAKRRLRKLVRIPTVKIPGTDIGIDINKALRKKT